MPREIIINKIISGGQSGVDRSILDFSIKYTIPHGGWCPKTDGLKMDKSRPFIISWEQKRKHPNPEHLKTSLLLMARLLFSGK